MLSVDWAVMGIILTILTAVSSLTWWLSGQFSIIRQLVYERINIAEVKILDKLEYHEKHDDTRFAQIRDELSEVRVRNATKDALLSSILAKIDKMNGR